MAQAKKVPLTQAPRLAIAGIKQFTGMEGYGLNATLYFDGQKVAEVLDEGCGGSMLFRYSSRATETDVVAYVTSLQLPPFTLQVNGNAYSVPTDLEALVNVTVDEEMERRHRARLLKTSVLFTVPGQPDWKYYSLTHGGRIERTQQYVLEKYPGATLLTA